MEVVKQKYPGLTHNRIPVCNSAAPLEADFDTIVNCLLGTNVNAPVIVNCQVMGINNDFGFGQNLDPKIMQKSFF